MIPPFQDLMLPIMEHATRDGAGNISNRDFIEFLAEHLHLTEPDRKELLASGNSRFDNRVHWALIHLRRAGLIESPSRGLNRITARGQEILRAKPARIDLKLLNQFPEFREFRGARAGGATIEPEPNETTASPEEALDIQYQKLRRALAAQLAERMRQCSPTFFERLVVELLVKMGYGGSRVDAGQAVGRSGDGGIDGIIKEDRLGLDTIYIQAKRWTESTVGRPQVQQFVGALQGHHAHKGIFITTSTFTKDARDYVSTIPSKIVLIDGPQLAEMMIDYDLGVSTVSIYELKSIDNDYFAE